MAVLAAGTPGLLIAGGPDTKGGRAGGVGTIIAPRLEGVPKLEDFLSMQPAGEIASRMARVDGFTQREPHDGEPASQRTEAYLGYNERHLFVVFVCFDDQPGSVRAHLTRRENMEGEDTVRVLLDTFADRRRSYGFVANPLGVQGDDIWTETNGSDASFDTVWDSRGSRTQRGYVVWIAIPWKSVRFPPGEEQRWGIILQRQIPRSSETSSWPHVSAKAAGTLTQEGQLTGLRGLPAGKNLSLTPYGVARSFKQLDLRDDVNPQYTSKHLGGTAGLDAKAVLHQSFVLDATFNPDFSQVESDEPQLTANQRFEVFFPEKRPFFLENSDYFQGPAFTLNGVGFFQPRENFVFTRRIQDPEIGLRLTGKSGPYSIGLLVSDDRGPGESVADNDPDFGMRAHFGIARIRRDFGDRASIGIFFTDREFSRQFNRVGGFDVRFKLDANWFLDAGAVYSSTNDSDDVYSTGPAYDFRLQRDGRQLNYSLEVHDTSPGFVTEAGFFRRPDIRRVLQVIDYKFRPEGKRVISWGPNLGIARSYDYSGLPLDEWYHFSLGIEFASQTNLGLFLGSLRETLRPKDFDALPVNRSYREPYSGFWVFSSPSRLFSWNLQYIHAASINFDPPDGVAPFLAKEENISVGLTLRPLTSLVIENTYLYDRLRDRQTGFDIFTNHILRSKWNYQFTRALSARLILQYNALLSNPSFSALDRSKNVNADFLITYLIHPGTALYVGYNSNFENIDPGLCRRLPSGLCDPDGPGLIFRNGRFVNDGRTFFVKLSYQFQF